jgi:hypothetical protein
MAFKTYPKHRSGSFERPAPLRMVAPSAPQPPSGALINVILEYADVEQSLGGGRVLLRLSARRMKDPTIKELLGREARRLAEVSVIWDEEEGELIRVQDDAQPLGAPSMADETSELDTFELTEAALDYIARHQRRAR